MADENKESMEEGDVAKAAEFTENVTDAESEDRTQKLENELEDFKKRYFYIAAEFENSKKRFEREKENLLKYGSEKILSSLVEVVDNFERTLMAISSDTDPKIKNIAVGIDMIQKQFLGKLKDAGLTPIDALGQLFDPNFHEALSKQKVDGKREQEIITEYQKGYMLNGRLLRASKVVVASEE